MSSRCEEMKISVTHRRVCGGGMFMECFSECMTKIYGDGVCLCLFLCVLWYVWKKIEKVCGNVILCVGHGYWHRMKVYMYVGIGFLYKDPSARGVRYVCYVCCVRTRLWLCYGVRDAVCYGGMRDAVCYVVAGNLLWWLCCFVVAWVKRNGMVCVCVLCAWPLLLFHTTFSLCS